MSVQVKGREKERNGGRGDGERERVEAGRKERRKEERQEGREEEKEGGRKRGEGGRKRSLKVPNTHHVHLPAWSGCIYSIERYK